jgi:hypothetical protein
MTDDDNEDRGRADHRTRFVHAPIIALAAIRYQSLERRKTGFTPSS